MKETKEPIKVSASTVLLIITMIIIAIMSYLMYAQKMKSDKEIADLQEEAKKSQSTINEMQTKLDSISNLANNTTIENTTTNIAENNDDVVYEITIREETYATIKATKDGKTVSKEFEMDAAIANTGTLDIPNVGKVAAVCNSGGEYYSVNIYQLVNNEIIELGNIDMGADTVEEATYTVETKNADTAVIKAQRNGETITKEFEMNAEIANTNVVDIFGTKVVMVAETGGEYYGIQVYRLSQDYTNGKTKEIRNVGLIKPIF